jgi:catechol 2,3-dioxygenase-like lactoylglutathione lyase family enzyme
MHKCSLRSLKYYAGLAIALSSVPVVAQMPSTDSLLGAGLGVDHVGLVVRDLEQVQWDYEGLGFKVSSGGSFPGGLSNKIIHFGNETYLELLSVKDPKTSSGEMADFVSFAGKHDGAMFLGLQVSSAKETATFLKTRNFDVTGPDAGQISKPGETEPPPPQWYTVAPADKPAAGKRSFNLPIFFIEYMKTTRSKLEQNAAQQPNGAMAITAAWIVVRDLPDQLKTLRAGGFAPEQSRKASLLGARGSAFRAGSGWIVLLDAANKAKPLRQYVSDYGDGIIAISVETSNIKKAAGFAESEAHAKPKHYKGTFGRSFLLPPTTTHGLWIEMFQR